MRLALWLRLAREIGWHPGLAPRLTIAGVTLGERLLGPAVVYAAVQVGAGRALAVGALLGAVGALRTVVQSAHVARTESALYVRVVDAVLRQDVLQPSVLPDEEARAALFEGAHDVAALLAEGLPALLANAVAAVIFAVLVAATQPPRVVVAAVAACAAGVLLLLLSRRAVAAARGAAAAAWIGLADGVGDAFDGRLEIVAAGKADAYVRAFDSTASSWRAATLREARFGRLAGRLPLVLLTLSVGAAVLLDSVLHGEPASATLGRAALLAAMAPAFIGLAHGAQELARSGRRLEHMSELVAVPPARPPAARQALGAGRSVELRDVHFTYARAGRRHEALRGVSLSWRAGEVLALAGPNGSGKSTCLRLALGLGSPSAGQVLVDGAPLERLDLDAWRARIAFLPQRPYLPPRVTVSRCLRFIETDVREQTMTDALERVGFGRASRRDAAGMLDARVDELSVGQRQRVALARLLCRQAPILLLDEPDANLDDAGVAMLVALVRELARQRTVVLVAHSPDLLAAADRVVRLEAGRVVGESTGGRSASA